MATVLLTAGMLSGISVMNYSVHTGNARRVLPSEHDNSVPVGIQVGARYGVQRAYTGGTQGGRWVYTGGYQGGAPGGTYQPGLLLSTLVCPGSSVP